jgi:DNA invertase Pin-like site-specific DNA recombinase
MTTAVIYARISVAETAPEGDAHEFMARSISTQLDVAKKLAKGYNIVDSYVDQSISGWSEGKRPEFNRMILDMQRGRFDVIITRHVDRLSRNDAEDYIIRTQSAKHGVKWLTQGGQLTDPATAQGSFMTKMLQAVAGMESSIKSERLKNHFQAARASGSVKAPTRPYGYSSDKVTADPFEAAVVRDAYAHILAGGSVYALVSRWNDNANIVPMKAKKWSHATVRAVLTRARNAGLVRDGQGYLEGVTGQWEALVSKETYDDAMTILRDPKRRTNPGRKAHWLASGIITCSVCGSPMRSSTVDNKGRGDRVSIYRCTRKLGAPTTGVRHTSARTTVVDAMVRDAVVSAFLFGPKDIIPGTVVSGNEALDVELSKVRAAKTNLTELLTEGLLSMQEVKPKLAALNSQEHELEEQVQNRARESAAAAMVVDLRDGLFTPGTVSLKSASKAKDALYGRFDNLTHEQRQNLVRTLLTVNARPGKGEQAVDIKHLVVTSLNED